MNLKWLLYALAFLILGPSVFVGVLVGGYLLKRFRNGSSPGADALSVNSLRRREWSRLRGWNLRGLPLGMSADLTTEKGETLRFSCAGIDNLVIGKHGRSEGATYSFIVPDILTARRVEQLRTSDSLDVDLSRKDDGSYEVSSRSAEAINKAALAAFPPRDVDARMDVSEVRQYRVDDCSSYEEAVSRVKAFRNGDDVNGVGICNSFVENRKTVDGHSSVVSSGSLLDASDVGTLTVGTFIVTECRDSSFAGKVQVPTNAGSEAFDRAVERDFSAGSHNRLSGPSVSYSDGVPSGVRRSLILDDGQVVRIGAQGDLSDMRLTVLCDSFDQALSVAGGAGVPQGIRVFVGKDVPQMMSAGKWPVSVPLDFSAIESMFGPVALSDEDLSRLSSFGLSSDSVLIGRALDALRDVNVDPELMKVVDFSGCSVAGVSYDEILDRCEDSWLPELSDDGLRKWVRNAGHIESVTFTLDEKEGVLRIISVVDGQKSVNERHVDRDEMDYFISRGTFSEAEKKDILMRSHPDYFERCTTSRSAFRDPVAELLKSAEDLNKTHKQCRKVVNGLSNHASKISL